MRLKRFLLRYYPPGITVECERSDGAVLSKTIDLLDLNSSTNLDDCISAMMRDEPVIKEKLRPQLRQLLQSLVDRQSSPSSPPAPFLLSRSLHAHLLPLTNCAFDKHGHHFITASYDRTAKLFSASSSELLSTFSGHKNVVYSLHFNLPFSDRVVTGSFDRTARIWRVGKEGDCLRVLAGHDREVVSVGWSTDGERIVTGSTDHTGRLWDAETGRCLHVLSGHEAEVVTASFDSQSALILTGSFDHSCRVYDVRTGQCVRLLAGHSGEISSASFSFSSAAVLTSSIDHSCKLFSLQSGLPMLTLSAHSDEVLDAALSLSCPQRIASASADGCVCIHDAQTGSVLHKLSGHQGEATRVAFNHKGDELLSVGADGVGKVWSVDSGEAVSVLRGHEDEIFGCAWNYEGDAILTASKDNTCKLWRRGGGGEAAVQH